MKVIVTVFDREKYFYEGYLASKLRQEVIEDDSLIEFNEDRTGYGLSDEFFKRGLEFIKGINCASWSPDCWYDSKHDVGCIDIYVNW